MIFAYEIYASGVHDTSQRQCLLTPSEKLIRARKIALHDENAIFTCAKPPLHSQLGLSHGQRVLVVSRIV